MVYEPPRKFCPNCNSLIIWGDSHCWKCGTQFAEPPISGTSGHFVHADVASNYSGTVTVSGSAGIAMEGIDALREYLSKHPIFEPARAHQA